MLPNIFLESSDKIGIKFDTHKGKIEFDLNSVELNVSYLDESLRINTFYPTIDLGLSDSVRIVPPPKTLVDIS